MKFELSILPAQNSAASLPQQMQQHQMQMSEIQTDINYALFLAFHEWLILPKILCKSHMNILAQIQCFTELEEGLK